MTLKETINRICLYILGSWVLVQTITITEKVYNESLSTFIPAVLAIIWGTYVLTISIKK